MLIKEICERAATAGLLLGDGSEVSGGGYSRACVGPTTWGDVYGKQVQNCQQIHFPQSAGDWGLIVGFALYDCDGNLLISGSLTTARRIPLNTDSFFMPGSVRLQE